jgi:hypothetical protein
VRIRRVQKMRGGENEVKGDENKVREKRGGKEKRG